MALKDGSDLICTVCNSNIDLNSCTNIFYVSLPHNKEVLAHFILKVLELTTADLHSSYVCLRCYNLFGMLEQAQWTATNIQSEIFKVFQINSNGKQSTNGSVGITSKIELTENISEIENFNQVEPKIIIEEHLPKKVFDSLDDTKNQIENDSAASNGANIMHSNECHSINDDKESKLISYTSMKECLENDNIFHESYETEVVNLYDTSIFSDEIIKTSNAKNQNELKLQDKEDNLQDDKSVNENLNSEQKSWKSGRISKYSQKPLKHTCPTCGKQWRTSTELKVHVKSHSNIRPYMCEKCGQAYKHKHALEIHVGMHNGVSPFRCNHCDKCFTQKGALQRHLPMHTGETPYQCELCGKRFVHHTSYKMHVLSHTGKKSYRCHICDLLLLSTSHLKRHMRVHTGEKPFSCTSCGKSFAERYNLQAHKKIHDPLQISKRNHYKCEQCEASFSTKHKLDDHTKQHSYNERCNEKWVGQTVEIDTIKNRTVNGADLLESCVNEVWQSLTKD